MLAWNGKKKRNTSDKKKNKTVLLDLEISVCAHVFLSLKNIFAMFLLQPDDQDQHQQCKVILIVYTLCDEMKRTLFLCDLLP